jgi:hypothetical protein
MRFLWATVLVCALAACGDDDADLDASDAAPAPDAGATDAAPIEGVQCFPCDDAGDCDAPAHCIDLGGGTRCSQDCDGDADCPRGHECTDDQCRPLYGTCDGDGEFCAPCLSDDDCTYGDQPACVLLRGGERSCLDAAYAAACFNDDDCPLAPSGLRGECLGMEEGLEGSDPRYQRCHAPHVDAIDDFSCWP